MLREFGSAFFLEIQVSEEKILNPISVKLYSFLILFEKS